MSDELFLQGKGYISSKRASVVTGYAQDYIGQLARSGVIDAQRVGGLWYVLLTSLEAYKQNAEQYQPVAPKVKSEPNIETIVSFDGKDYVSSTKAAKLTGYNPDYVGQLARAGKVLSRQIGNRWYVEREGLVAHKAQKDALLASVQAESVGLAIAMKEPVAERGVVPTNAYADKYLTYIREDDALMPTISRSPEGNVQAAALEHNESHAVPIRRVVAVPRNTVASSTAKLNMPPRNVSQIGGKTMIRAAQAAAVLTVVLVISYGLTSLKSDSVYAIFKTGGAAVSGTMLASVAVSFNAFFEILEGLVVRELHYIRN